MVRVSSLALLAGAAAGIRMNRRKDSKFIAGVPVLNYQAAYGGKSPGDLGTEDEWNVLLKKGATDAEINKACAAAPHGCNLQGHPDKGGLPFLEMRGSEEDLEAVVKAADGLVEFIEPDTQVYAIPELAAESTAVSDLWGLERVAAYSRSSDGDGVTVFVLDTGVRVSHQDFGGRAIATLDMTAGAVECNGDSSCAADRQGHGTHCAGSAAGAQYGIASGASIRSVKVLGDSGSGSWSFFFGGLDWVASSSIRPAVVSASLGGPGTLGGALASVDGAVNAGVTVVVAAGNSNNDACGLSPAYVPSAITVGATAENNGKASYSSYGECVNIWAPGSNIVSAAHTSDTGTRGSSGTSMACPHVAGGAALVLQQNPSYLAPKVLEELQATARTDELTGLRPLDTNKELYVGAGGAPQPSPTPAPRPGSWTLFSGSGCEMTGDCVQSLNYPSNYGNAETCTVTWEGDLELTVEAFGTENGYDVLTLGGIAYSGSSGPPDGTYSGSLSWGSDFSTTSAPGWRICKPPTTWTLSGSGCEMTGDCVQSLNYPSNYGNNERCSVTWDGDLDLTVEAFGTEAGYDVLTLGGNMYAGSYGPPSGVYSGFLEWWSDFSGTSAPGWKVCKA